MTDIMIYFLKICFRPRVLLLLWVMMLGQLNGGLASLVLTASKVDSGVILPGKTAFILVTITHTRSAVDSATDVSIELSLPSYVIYDQFTSNGSRAPDGVTTTRNNQLSIKMKFNKLPTSEHAVLQVAVHVDPANSFDDGSFHHAPCRVSLRYQEAGGSCAASVIKTHEMTQITFFSPACDGFGALGLQTGGLKDSQITASSSRATEFLPYSARTENSVGGWIPLKYSGEELLTVHFIQVDLRQKVLINMAAIQGVPKAIPPEKIILSVSKDGLDWKLKNNAVKTMVDLSSITTVTVMKALQFTASARFVRVVLPPYDKPLKKGEELPDYKFELFSCPDSGNGRGKNFVSLPVGVGVESGAIPDNQLTSSSVQGPEYGTQYSRLNSRSGGGAWCARSCDPSNYLQIGLGLVHLVQEFEVQSKHGDSGGTDSVLSFYFEYSADGSSWQYYTANGANKLFLGSPLRNLAIRHKLLFPVLARFVRFRPKTCVNMTCMRVDLYWYPDLDAYAPVAFARSFLLIESTNTVFACNSEVCKSSEGHCKMSSDGGNTWQDLLKQVLNVLAYDPSDDIYYGISTNKKTLLRSKFSPLMEWTGINDRIWNKVKASPSLITATEVPFAPVLLADASEPYDALKVPSLGVSYMWGASLKGLLFKPSGAATWKLVFSWFYCPDDLRIGCLGMPCKHGTCAEISQGGYRCTCYRGYTGKRCRIDIDECSSNPCTNGAVCVDKVNHYICTCPPGFTGAQCDININECASNPCVNGICVDGVNMFTCTCNPGYTGVLCELDFDECSSTPCINGGVCVNAFNKFNCTCPPGFTGARCEINIDDCESSPCIGGACIDGANRYTCNCNPGYSGLHCEFDNTACTPNPCKNGGTCSLKSGGGYDCDCTFYYGGTDCDIGDFLCARGDYSYNQPYWPNTGKFDKISFSVSADQYIIGIIAASNIHPPVPKNAKVTVKLSDIAGNLIATTSVINFFTSAGVFVFFDRPYRVTAGQQYIAATQVYIPPSTYPPLIQVVNTVTSTQCGPPGHNLTVTFSTVPQAELDDSNGSTVDKGRVPKLVFKPL